MRCHIFYAAGTANHLAFLCSQRNFCFYMAVLNFGSHILRLAVCQLDEMHATKILLINNILNISVFISWSMHHLSIKKQCMEMSRKGSLYRRTKCLASFYSIIHEVSPCMAAYLQMGWRREHDATKCMIFHAICRWYIPQSSQFHNKFCNFLWCHALIMMITCGDLLHDH